MRMSEVYEGMKINVERPLRSGLFTAFEREQIVLHALLFGFLPRRLESRLSWKGHSMQTSLAPSEASDRKASKPMVRFQTASMLEFRCRDDCCRNSLRLCPLFSLVLGPDRLRRQMLAVGMKLCPYGASHGNPSPWLLCLSRVRATWRACTRPQQLTLPAKPSWNVTSAWSHGIK